MADPKDTKKAHLARGGRVAIPKKNPPVVTKKMAKSITSDFNLKRQAKFDERHVRWTGYLTNTNNTRLRSLLAEGKIPSLTRFINEAVEYRLQERFGIAPEETA